MWPVTAPAANSDSVNLYLKWFHKAQFAGIYMADINGYFSEEGLSVNILGYDPQWPPLDALRDGVAEYSLQDPEIFSLVDGGLDFVSIAAYGQISPWTLAVTGSIGQIEDLSGKTVLVPEGYASKLLNSLIQAHVVLDVNVKTYQTPAEFHYLLKTGNIQAVLGYRSNEVYFFQKRHPDTRLIDLTPVDYSIIGSNPRTIVLYSDILVATRHEAVEHPERVAAMIRAVNKGWRYVIDNPQKSLDAIYTKYHMKSLGFDKEQSAFELEYMINAVALPNVPLGSQSLSRWSLILNHYRSIGIISGKPIDLSHYIWDGRLMANKITANIASSEALIIKLVGFFLVTLTGLLVIFRDNLTRYVKHRSLLNDVKRGLKAQEFEFHFQPVVKFDGQLTSAEALIRWKHPKKGLLYPGAFIEAIEQHPTLIQRFDMYVIEQVLKTLSEMPKDWTRDLKFSVNVSAHFFDIPYFDERIKQLSQQYAVPLHSLDIELTERLSVNSFEALAQAVRRLKDIGLTVTLDDYGTGYTSLSMLNTVPFDKLKIDKSLIDLIEQSERARGTLKSIHMLAQVHGMDIVCEGVETEAQVGVILNELDPKSLNLQGYYYSRPQPKNVFEFRQFPITDPQHHKRILGAKRLAK